MKAVIMAAGRGSRLGPLTNEAPKVLLNFRGKSLLDWHIFNLRAGGYLEEIYVIVGYKRELFKNFDIELIVNHDWDKGSVGSSLWAARRLLRSDNNLIIYGDVFYKPSLVTDLLNKPTPCVSSVQNWNKIWRSRALNPLDDLESFRISENGKFLSNIGQKVKSLQEIQGQFAGLYSLNPSIWESISDQPRLLQSDTTTILQIEIEKGMRIEVTNYKEEWREFDLPSDFKDK